MKKKFVLGLQAALIVLAGCWVFFPARHGTWLWDDDMYITRNLALRSAAGLWRIWFAPPGVNYFPVTFTVQWLQWHGWGNNPLGYHWTNVALHLLSSLLFWHLLEKLGVRLAWLGGLLFAVHPATVESVAWISELKNTLSLPPLLLAMCAYLDYDTRGRRRDYLVSVLWFLVAMLCKSTVVMFPVVLLLWLWWKHGRLRIADLGASTAFFLISLVFGLVSVSFEHKRMMLGFDDTPLRDLSSRAAAAGLAVAFYFSKCVFPAALLPTYPRWKVHPVLLRQFLPWLVFIALLMWWWTKRSTWGRHALFGFGCFIIALVPILGLVPMSYQRISWVADHFVYLPLLGLIGPAAAAFGELPARLAARNSRLPAAPWLARSPVIGWLGLAVAIATLAWASHRYAAIFTSRPAFWSYTLKRNPNSWGAYNDLGTTLLREDQPARAMADFQAAIRLEPSSASAHNNLGDALVKLGRLPEAIDQYELVLRLGADYPTVYYNLAIALAQTGRLPQAISLYQKALRLQPGYAEAENDLGLALAASGRRSEAIAHFERALQLQGDFPKAANNLGATLLETGRTKEGIARLEEALRLRPDYADAHANLGVALARSNRLTEAISEFEEVLRLRANFPGIHSRLGDALAEVGRLPEAIAHYREALRQDPDNAAIHYNLGLVFRALGEDGAATLQFEQAARDHAR